LPIAFLSTRSFLNFAAQTLNMNKWGLVVVFLTVALLFAGIDAEAQCSICTKTASQLGEKPAKALNGAIIYLMSTPLLIIGFIGWRWWKMQKKEEQ
jgi:hypothetical protein